VYEVVPDEVSFGELIARAGGMVGEEDELKAIQPGGPSSAFISSVAVDVTLDNAAVIAAGSQPGCLAVRVLSQRRCIVEELCELTAFFAREQCGQCPACRMKTQTYAGLMKKIKEGQGRWEMLAQFQNIDEFVVDMPSKCALIAMPTPPIVSGMTLFREDFAAHIDSKVCAVGR
jgi:NADH:ubiquinone oxidoreductase subunit F (NADH-binding)